jgi:carbon monoxide dehydrogenase subunit G
VDIHERIEVEADVDAVWAVLADPYAVVSCIPGAEIVGRREDGSYDATVGIKFGPTRLAFKGRVQIDLDEAAHRGRVVGRGKDGVGGTRVEAEARFEVDGSEGGSTILLSGDVRISGRLATFIEAGANLVVNRMSAEFAQRLKSRVSTQR